MLIGRRVQSSLNHTTGKSKGERHPPLLRGSAPDDNDPKPTPAEPPGADRRIFERLRTMAMIYILAMVTIMATIHPGSWAMHRDNGGHSLSAKRGLQAEGVVRAAFERAGWRVDAVRTTGNLPEAATWSYARSAGLPGRSEGRCGSAGGPPAPALVAGVAAGGARRRQQVPTARGGRSTPDAARVAQQVLDFAVEHAPGGAAGVVDFEGLQRFQGDVGGTEQRAEPDGATPAGGGARAGGSLLGSESMAAEGAPRPALPADYLNAPQGRVCRGAGAWRRRGRLADECVPPGAAAPDGRVPRRAQPHAPAGASG